MGSTWYFDSYCGRYKIISVTPTRLLETQFLRKKRNFSSGERILACFFSLSRVSQTWGAILWISTRCFDSCCGSYKILSVTYKRLLKTQILGKKRKLSSEEKLLACFFLAFSSVTNLRSQFMNIYKVFWQLMWKLKY